MAGTQTIGIVGGGQLGRMLTLAAKPLGFDVVVLDTSEHCPAAQVGARVIIGNLYDKKALQELSKQSDVITIEIEHLDAAFLGELANAGTPVHPAPATIELIQNKYQQKIALQAQKIATAPFVDIATKEASYEALKKFGGQMVVKTKHGAYDGRGNAVVKNKQELDAAWKLLGEKELYAEKLITFSKELSVIMARDTKGTVAYYDVVEMQHERNICLEVTAPAQINKKAAANAMKLAKQTSKILDGAGIFAIEMFLLADDSVLVNEIAPRVHNSGHHSIESCVTSQFEQHIRAVSGLPLGETRLISPAVMVNILGTASGDVTLDIHESLDIPNTHLHWYDKSPVKVDRKMGHITSLSDTVEVATVNARKARKAVKI